ncbi:MAG: hypothetical protein B6D55_02585 [Candidatus Omnitrophica bacterium 4484_70.2]|nr:MAG: hypothetical protein B6D55_02585 [Candidatus Omnitrophica bacterium 4484_70.2]
MSMTKKILLFSLFIGVLSAKQLFADDGSQWWNKEEMSNLNVLQDLNEGSGRIWYVDGKNGDDNNSGISLEHAFKTIAKAVSKLRAGDIVRIAAGVYKERLFINRSGTEKDRIVIGPYGNGEVVIDASVRIDEWQRYKNNIYGAHCEFHPVAVVLDDIPLFPEFSLAEVDNGKWFYDNKDKMVYVYIPSGDPSMHDIGVISNNAYQDGVVINDASYITLYGLTVRFAGGRGISILGDYNKVQKCVVKFNGGIGINLFTYKNIETVGIKIIENHIFGNFLRNWPLGTYKWGGWGGGVVSHGTPEVYFIGNIVHNNGGEGLLAYGNAGGAVFENNIVYDNWSVNIYLDGRYDSIVEGNFIFSHDPDSGVLYHNKDKNPKDGKNFRRLRPEGIMTADERFPATFHDIRIVNNIIVGCRRGITHYGHAKDSGLKNVLIANNTIILPNKKGVGERFIGIRIPYNHGNNSNVIIRNNIVYGENPDTYLLSIDYDPAKFNNFGGLIFDHNIWYNPNSSCSFHMGSRWLKIYDIGFNKWAKKCRENGQGEGSKFVDPKFVNAVGYAAKGLRLSSDSPAINAGIFIEGVTTDYFGNKRDGEPDIGAIEFVGE